MILHRVQEAIWLLLEWILQNMVRHFVTHKQVQADKRHSIQLEDNCWVSH